MVAQDLIQRQKRAARDNTRNDGEKVVSPAKNKPNALLKAFSKTKSLPTQPAANAQLIVLDGDDVIDFGKYGYFFMDCLKVFFGLSYPRLKSYVEAITTCHLYWIVNILVMMISHTWVLKSCCTCRFIDSYIIMTHVDSVTTFFQQPSGIFS